MWWISNTSIVIISWLFFYSVWTFINFLCFLPEDFVFLLAELIKGRGLPFNIMCEIANHIPLWPTNACIGLHLLIIHDIRISILYIVLAPKIPDCNIDHWRFTVSWMLLLSIKKNLNWRELSAITSSHI